MAQSFRSPASVSLGATQILEPQDGRVFIVNNGQRLKSIVVNKMKLGLMDFINLVDPYYD